MLLRPSRSIRVTSKEQLEAALRSADEVIVEGDDALLSFAVAMAARDPANRIDIRMDRELVATPEPAAMVGAAIGGAGRMPAPARMIESDATMGARPMARTPTPEPAGGATPQSPPPPVVPRGVGRRYWTVAVLACVLCIAAGLALFAAYGPLEHPLGGQAQPVVVPPPPSPPVGGSPPLPVPPPAGIVPALVTTTLPAMAWPLVSIVAIVALFLIARQAIAGGQNVEISWKVTEKVTGRLVIKKVRTPVGKERSVA